MTTKQNGIEHLRTSPFHPQSNGQAERFVDTFKRSINKLQGEGNLDENLETFLKMYRTAPNDNCPSKKSPAEIMLGRKIRTVFDLLKPVNKSEATRNTKMEEQFNRKHGAKSRNFDVKEKVYVQIHKNSNWRWEEGVIKEKVGSVNYVVAISHRDIKAHANQIKKRYTESNEITEIIPISTLTNLFEQENLLTSSNDTKCPITLMTEPTTFPNDSVDLVDGLILIL